VTIIDMRAWLKFSCTRQRTAHACARPGRASPHRSRHSMARWPRLRYAAGRSCGVISAMRVGCSEMVFNGRWLFMALLAVAIGALAGCAATGPLSGDPCWGFFACTGWH
jgi:hypothetical protein